MASRTFLIICKNELMTFVQFMEYTRMTLEGTPSEKRRHLFDFIALNKSRFYFKDLAEFYQIMTASEVQDLYKSKIEEKDEPEWLIMTRLTWGMMEKRESQMQEQYNLRNSLEIPLNRLKSLKPTFPTEDLTNKSPNINVFSRKKWAFTNADEAKLVQSGNDEDKETSVGLNIGSVNDFLPNNEKEDSYVTFEEFEEFIKKNALHVELFNFFHENSRNLLTSLHSGKPYYEMLGKLENLEHLLENLEYIIYNDDKTINVQTAHKFTNKYYNTFIKMLGRNKFDHPENVFSSEQARKTIDNFTAINRGMNPRTTIGEKYALQNKMTRIISDTLERFNEESRMLQDGPKLPPIIKVNDNDFSLADEDLEKDILIPNETTKPYDSGRSLPNLRFNMFRSMMIRVSQMKSLVKAQLDKILDQKILTRAYLKSNSKKVVAIQKNKNVVFVNNKNWNIVTSMINGIQKSLSMVMNEKDHTVSKIDFKMHNKLEMESIFSTAFNRVKFKDYAPRVFLNIRRMFGISNEAYMRSLGVDTFINTFFDKLLLMLSENSSGKSGSILFHTSDGKFLVKSIHKAEFETLREILYRYYQHLQQNPQTLLTRFFGLHEIKCYKGQLAVEDIFIVVMNNVFDLADPENIKNKYDLKGSSYGRWTKPADIEKGSARKDNNFIDDKLELILDEQIHKKLTEQIIKDSKFLASKNIIDYSLLIGTISGKSDPDNKPMFYVNEGFSYRGRRQSYVESEDEGWHYYVGIIDTLTYFDLKKKSEFAVKRLFQGSGISCLPPKSYQERFCEFVENTVFKKKTKSV